jgi:hypothetical protein
MADQNRHRAERQGPAGQDAGADEARRRPKYPGADLDDRNRAGWPEGGGDLGAATPPNVDIHDLGQEDNPQEDWGEEVQESMHSGNHTRRPLRTEAERGQGAKTRRMNKDIVSRRT